VVVFDERISDSRAAGVKVKLRPISWREIVLTLYSRLRR